MTSELRRQWTDKLLVADFETESILRWHMKFHDGVIFRYKGRHRRFWNFLGRIKTYFATELTRIKKKIWIPVRWKQIHERERIELLKLEWWHIRVESGKLGGKNVR